MAVVSVPVTATGTVITSLGQTLIISLTLSMPGAVALSGHTPIAMKGRATPSMLSSGSSHHQTTYDILGF